MKFSSLNIQERWSGGFIRAITSLFFLLLLNTFSSSSFATALVTDTSGSIVGVNGVNVQGSLYDVSFIDGPCEEAMGGECDSADDFFFSDKLAWKASMSLFNFFDPLFTDDSWNNPGVQLYTSGSVIEGCEVDYCEIVTPTFDADINEVSYKYFAFWIDSGINGDQYGGSTVLSDPVSAFEYYNENKPHLYTFAKWSDANVSPVPNPATLPLLVIGMIGLVSFRRKLRV